MPRSYTVDNREVPLWTVLVVPVALVLLAKVVGGDDDGGSPSTTEIIVAIISVAGVLLTLSVLFSRRKAKYVDWRDVVLALISAAGLITSFPVFETIAPPAWAFVVIIIIVAAHAAILCGYYKSFPEELAIFLVVVLALAGTAWVANFGPFSEAESDSSPSKAALAGWPRFNDLPAGESLQRDPMAATGHGGRAGR